MSGYNINNDEHFRLKQIYQPSAPTQTLRSLEVSTLKTDTVHNTGNIVTANLGSTSINNTGNIVTTNLTAANLGTNTLNIGGYPYYSGYPQLAVYSSGYIIASFGASYADPSNPGYEKVVIVPGAIGNQTFDLTAWAPLGLLNGAIVSTSDEKLKENIIDANLDLCYNNINTLTLKRFKYKDNINYKKEDKHQLGILAQDLQKIFKKSVTELPHPSGEVTDDKTLGINTDQLFYCMLGCIQSLQKKNESHESRLNKLENLLNKSN